MRRSHEIGHVDQRLRQPVRWRDRVIEPVVARQFFGRRRARRGRRLQRRMAQQVRLHELRRIAVEVDAVAAVGEQHETHAVVGAIAEHRRERIDAAVVAAEVETFVRERRVAETIAVGESGRASQRAFAALDACDALRRQHGAAVDGAAADEEAHELRKLARARRERTRRRQRDVLVGRLTAVGLVAFRESGLQLRRQLEIR